MQCAAPHARLSLLGPVVAIAAASAVSLACTAGSVDSGALGNGAPTSDPSVTSCDAGATCPSAESIGTISGDTRADHVSADGVTSTWLHVGVTEDDSAWAGRPVHIRATLTSTATESFELHAYLDPTPRDDAGLDCTHEVARSAPAAAGGAVLDYSWGDPPDGSANGYDDGRTVALEVRNVSGVCASDATWHLDVRGN